MQKWIEQVGNCIFEYRNGLSKLEIAFLNAEMDSAEKPEARGLYINNHSSLQIQQFLA